ncbi:phosphohydrolase (MutT/nudix family protein) [Luminiphilus syltensis NOR5-1B]|uniref:Phosphohydrolase (MutT/nudix family protein) n=1 Tax=Luminiphilus syltensis NOR5-1B TaxID=565045 RepID=B8KSH3_9GAMM|nr:MSMEG_1061 family FMN-dependent PPOX-type flavoprotein [Luminiphilus syltensis]EED34706.1 phosphohydrolase (MutT/nudix family protein) [Luminiphilus syltensis NOR5-1B]
MHQEKDAEDLSFIETEEALEENYGEPLEIAKAIMLESLDKYHTAFINASPFCCIATADAGGQPTISPKGDAPGFVKIIDSNTLLIPDRMGNNKLESFHNLIESPKLGLIFFVPGYKETLRLSGHARLIKSEELLAYSAVNGRHLDVGLLITVTKAYFHCGKAVIRSKLWTNEYQPEDKIIPSFGQIIGEQAESDMAVSVMDDIVDHAYQDELY